MKETLSIRLMKTLRRGKKQLHKEALGRITQFVCSQRLEDGSFQNKSGQSDLYYTLFGWTLCHLLGIPQDRKKNNAYLAGFDVDRLDLIHYAAYMRCRMLNARFPFGTTRLKKLEDFKGVPHNNTQSPYTQYVWLTLQEDVQSLRFNVQGSTFKNPELGTLNLEPGTSNSTNATVAALAIKGQTEGYKDKDHPGLHYLYHLQEASGGFAAAEASPLPDLLSTATSLFILSCYGIQTKYPARDFIEAHWLDSGGFSATIVEDTSDVEYTFYGLLALGAAEVQSSRFKVQSSRTRNHEPETLNVEPGTLNLKL